MLFLLKRTWLGGLAGLLVLTLLATVLRAVLPLPLPVELSQQDLLNGFLVLGLVLVSDGSIHGILLLALGQYYRDKHRELAGMFRGQTLLAIVCGASMAGIGEELLFRGLDPGAGYLIGNGIVFGLLHHIRCCLWLFTFWSGWQGLLFAGAMLYFQRLGVTMTAHFLHDLTGFLLLRFLYNRPIPQE